MNPHFKEFEKNQSSEERHFGIMKKRQSGRPNLRLESLLVEEQNKQFAKYPNIFKDLGYEDEKAEALLGCADESDFEIADENNTEMGEKGDEEIEEDIEKVIQRILMEREDELSDSEDEELVGDEEE